MNLKSLFSGFKRGISKFNRSRSVYLHTLRILVNRNKLFILSFIFKAILISINSYILSTEKIFKFRAVQKIYKNSSDFQKITTGTLHFSLTHALVDLTYFYSSFSPYNDSSISGEGIEEIKVREANDISQENGLKFSELFEYREKDLKSKKKEDKYVIRFEYNRCLETYYSTHKRNMESGCDLYVIGYTLKFVVVFSLAINILEMLGLILYSRSLFPSSPLHKLTLSFSLINCFVLFQESFLIFFMEKEIYSNRNEFTAIFNNTSLEFEGFCFFGVEFTKIILGLLMGSVVNFYVVKRLIMNLKLKDRKSLVKYKNMMNKEVYIETESSLTETIDKIGF